MPSFLTAVLSLLLLLCAGPLCAETQPAATEEAEATEAEAADTKKDGDEDAEESAGPLRAEEDDKKDEDEEDEKDKAEDEKKARPIPQLPQQDPGYDKKLDQIVLPDDPTRQQVKDYVDALKKLVQNKRMFSTQDPEVDKLSAVPAEHFDLVLSLMYDRTMVSFYAEYAIAKIDAEALREHVTPRLADNPDLIGLLVTYGWLQDAKPVIMSTLASAEPGVSTAWFQAFVELAEPEHYEKLHELAVGSPQAAHYITLLKALPDYDLTRTISACWEKRAKNNRPRHVIPMHYHNPHASLAVHAAGIGKVEALGQLITKLEHNRPTRSYGRQNGVDQTRLDVTRFITFRGSNQEIKAWFKTNQDKLVFDHQTQRFVVEEDF